MEIKKIPLRQDNKDVYLDVYLNETPGELSIKKRPAILVCPGGGYTICSRREAEPIARAYMAHGYNAAVLYYSLGEKAVDKNPLEDASRAIMLLRRNAEEWNIIPDNIAVIGFSAGGHLAGWISTMWDDPDICRRCGVTVKGENRPDASILCYPVISSGDRGHKNSFYNILGTTQPTGEQLELYSLEKRVTPQTPPAFLWHTAGDNVVPVENSLCMAQAYAQNNVSFELHIFPKGVHGLSLANAEVLPVADEYVGRWVEMSLKWLNKTFNIEL
ncbi:MAG: alpha/beta hydrolase [Clostridia bacterium]|nr:alpha/beta hydrolase [Clostridia bacterium]